MLPVPFKNMTDLEMVEELFDTDRVKIVHDAGERQAQEILESLDEVLSEYENAISIEEDANGKMREMEKHIRKLEKMLVKRNVKFKDWDEIESESFWMI